MREQDHAHCHRRWCLAKMPFGFLQRGESLFLLRDLAVEFLRHLKLIVADIAVIDVFEVFSELVAQCHKARLRVR